MVLGLGNAEVRRVRQLRRDAEARDREAVFLIEGHRMLREALEAGVEVEAVYVPEGGEQPAGGPVAVEVSARAFATMSDTVSGSSLVAVAKRPAARRPSHEGLVVVLDGVADPGNVGTLVRSAEAAGASRVVLVGECADPWSPKVVRASAGAIFLVSVARGGWDDLEQGRAVLGLTSAARDGVVELRDLDPARHWPASHGVAVVVGNEARGVSAGAPVSTWVTIAHRGRVESLNAAMAGTVAVMHLARLLADAGK